MAGRISIVGLGPGALSGLTQEASQVIEEATAIFLRTVEHPAAREIAARYDCTAFDSAYAAGASFEDVYRTIVDRVLAASGRHSGRAAAHLARRELPRALPGTGGHGRAGRAPGGRRRRRRPTPLSAPVASPPPPPPPPLFPP